jgi:uracil phosphoribosyltransferase
VYVPPHPLVKHWLAIARNAATPDGMFRGACAELGRILIYEAVRDLLPTVDAVVDTPLGQSEVTIVDPTQPIKARAQQLFAHLGQGGEAMMFGAVGACIRIHLHC